MTTVTQTNVANVIEKIRQLVQLQLSENIISISSDGESFSGVSPLAVAWQENDSTFESILEVIDAYTKTRTIVAREAQAGPPVV